MHIFISFISIDTNFSTPPPRGPGTIYICACVSPPSTLPPSPHSVHPTCVNEHRIGVVVALRVPVPTKTSAFALRRRVSMSTCARARVHVQMCAHSNYTTTTATRTDYMPVRARAPQTPSGLSGCCCCCFNMRGFIRSAAAVPPSPLLPHANCVYCYAYESAKWFSGICWVRARTRCNAISPHVLLRAPRSRFTRVCNIACERMCVSVHSYDAPFDNVHSGPPVVVSFSFCLCQQT